MFKESEEPIYHSLDDILDILSDDKFINIRNKILSNKNTNLIPNEIEFSRDKKKKCGNDGIKIYIIKKLFYKYNRVN